MAKNFNQFIEQLSETNATLDYFVDFDKVNTNVEKIKIKLNQLNYLIGQKDLKNAVEKLFQENSTVFNVLDILIAVRKKDKKVTFNNSDAIVLVETYFDSPDLVYEFIEETGLGNIFKNKNITNLVDYVFGIEVGLDTNARKNRGGTQMENAVAKIFERNKIAYEREVKNTKFKELLSLGEDVKRFDFVIKGEDKIYLIETNYYNTGGSKLNEVARAYTDIAPKINQYKSFEFVWITDGQGWLSAKNKLEEAYNNISKVYNLTSIKEFINILKQID
jgi:type II restriction enzyme